jgi:hypothetical protein
MAGRLEGHILKDAHAGLKASLLWGDVEGSSHVTSFHGLSRLYSDHLSSQNPLSLGKWSWFSLITWLSKLQRGLNLVTKKTILV